MTTPFITVRDLLRYAVSRFNASGLAYGHGSDNAYDEAAYLILHTLHLPLDTLEPFLDARLLASEIEEVLAVIARRQLIRSARTSPWLSRSRRSQRPWPTSCASHSMPE